MPAIPLTQYDIIFAVVGAAAIFILIKLVSAAVRFIINSAREISFDPTQIDNVLENCYRTFPIDSFSFNGATIRRGIFVRITTTRQATFEGRFIGINRADMVCLMTENKIIAQEINAIAEINAL